MVAIAALRFFFEQFAIVLLGRNIVLATLENAGFGKGLRLPIAAGFAGDGVGNRGRRRIECRPRSAPGRNPTMKPRRPTTAKRRDGANDPLDRVNEVFMAGALLGMSDDVMRTGSESTKRRSDARKLFRATVRVAYRIAKCRCRRTRSASFACG